MTQYSLSRRHLLRLGALGAGALAGPQWTSKAYGQSSADSHFLFVITAAGGGSIIDSFLPIAQSEVSSPDIAARRPVYPDMVLAQPPGSNFRCVRNLSDQFGGVPFRSDYDPVNFLSKHKDDMLVMTVENTSVSHLVAQNRSMTGDGIDRGRTITEAMAMAHGTDLPLPNAIMSSGGFTENGVWSEVPDIARGVLIDNAQQFALATDGRRGISGTPSRTAVARARQARVQLESTSEFGQRFSTSEARRRFLTMREGPSAKIEASDLINKLLLVDGTTRANLEELGLASSPDLARLQAVLPNLDKDPLHAQTALAFLLARYQVSCAVTFGPSYIPQADPNDPTTAFGAPLAFDFSHNNHLVGQNVSWCRLLEVTDALIGLLKTQPHGDGSMWDRSLIYVATR